MNARAAPRVADPANTAGTPSGLFADRNFALLWVGQAVSLLGDIVFDTTLVLWIATTVARAQSWAPFAVSGVLVAAALPTLLVGPLAGVFVDRWDRRGAMLWSDALRALLILALLPATGVVALPLVPSGSLPLAWQLGAIYGVVGLASACAQFFNPARLALTGDVVAEPERGRAAGLEQVTLSLVIVIAPAVAAPLFVAVGIRWALLIDAASFALSFLAVSALRVTPQPRDMAGRAAGVWREFGQGLRLYATNRVLRTLIVTALIVVLGAGALNALDYFFATTNLHTPLRLYGLLGAGFGLGALVGAVLSTLFVKRLGVVRLFWFSILALGVIVLVYARLNSFGPALATLALFGLANAAVNVCIGPMVLGATPRAYVGRVSALLMPAISLASLLSIGLAGLLVSTVLRRFHATVLGVTFGPIDTVFTVTGLLTLAGGLYAMIGLRGVVLGDDGRAADGG